MDIYKFDDLFFLVYRNKYLRNKIFNSIKEINRELYYFTYDYFNIPLEVIINNNNKQLLIEKLKLHEKYFYNDHSNNNNNLNKNQKQNNSCHRKNNKELYKYYFEINNNNDDIEKLVNWKLFDFELYQLINKLYPNVIFRHNNIISDIFSSAKLEIFKDLELKIDDFEPYRSNDYSFNGLLSYSIINNDLDMIKLFFEQFDVTNSDTHSSRGLVDFVKSVVKYSKIGNLPQHVRLVVRNVQVLEYLYSINFPTEQLYVSQVCLNEDLSNLNLFENREDLKWLNNEDVSNHLKFDYLIQHINYDGYIYRGSFNGDLEYLKKYFSIIGDISYSTLKSTVELGYDEMALFILNQFPTGIKWSQEHLLELLCKTDNIQIVDTVLKLMGDISSINFISCIESKPKFFEKDFEKRKLLIKRLCRIPCLIKHYISQINNIYHPKSPLVSFLKSNFNPYHQHQSNLIQPSLPLVSNQSLIYDLHKFQLSPIIMNFFKVNKFNRKQLKDILSRVSNKILLYLFEKNIIAINLIKKLIKIAIHTSNTLIINLLLMRGNQSFKNYNLFNLKNQHPLQHQQISNYYNEIHYLIVYYSYMDFEGSGTGRNLSIINYLVNENYIFKNSNKSNSNNSIINIENNNLIIKNSNINQIEGSNDNNDFFFYQDHSLITINNSVLNNSINQETKTFLNELLLPNRKNLCDQLFKWKEFDVELLELVDQTFPGFIDYKESYLTEAIRNVNLQLFKELENKFPIKHIEIVQSFGFELKEKTKEEIIEFYIYIKENYPSAINIVSIDKLAIDIILECRSNELGEFIISEYIRYENCNDFTMLSLILSTLQNNRTDNDSFLEIYGFKINKNEIKELSWSCVEDDLSNIHLFNDRNDIGWVLDDYPTSLLKYEYFIRGSGSSTYCFKGSLNGDLEYLKKHVLYCSSYRKVSVSTLKSAAKNGYQEMVEYILENHFSEHWSILDVIQVLSFISTESIIKILSKLIDNKKFTIDYNLLLNTKNSIFISNYDDRKILINCLYKLPNFLNSFIHHINTRYEKKSPLSIFLKINFNPVYIDTEIISANLRLNQILPEYGFSNYLKDEDDSLWCIKSSVYCVFCLGIYCVP
ncbi:hypothetical protein DICPUDRAFT_153981 [Dictyostelium purpureum]|uniref:Uncharacterized protein n=1 Tax=Dictyostelium purpureum TaxID=5786 RepID=F0ZQ89_DICPU|nr:uncharacterized protein DICPUDRAFT_153981 [Dictyostelium purpureum]EGC33903.1 hypothetical protein DICPUDRAFT_153981 [Dictyostelium purpureum]|eukprot:XP_003289586.1 hypothetical protein DICPUDRAFT_153981 [Dictyostelium purpureum]